MVSFSSLLLPVLVSGVVVFLIAGTLYMGTPLHKKDMSSLHNEDDVANALRASNVSPGIYGLPHATDMGSPEYQEKVKRGPVAFITVLPNRMFSMWKNLTLTFLMYLFVSAALALIASRVLSVNATRDQIICLIGGGAFIAYAIAGIPHGIWYGRPWRLIAKETFEAVLFAIVTAVTFAWLWPD